MSKVQICDMDTTTEYFVGTCSHVDESDEIDAASKRRTKWFRDMHKKGLRVKVALLDDRKHCQPPHLSQMAFGMVDLQIAFYSYLNASITVDPQLCCGIVPEVVSPSLLFPPIEGGKEWFPLP